MRINGSSPQSTMSKMATPIVEEKIDQNLKIRTGMVMVSDGKTKPEPMRLHLSMEMITLQKQDTSTPTSSSNNSTNQLPANSHPPIESKVSSFLPYSHFKIYVFPSIHLGTHGTNN